MKVKTSITISDDVLQEIGQNLERYKSRSSFIETAVQYYLIHEIRKDRNKDDLDILNRMSNALNQEAADVLSYQEKL